MRGSGIVKRPTFGLPFLGRSSTALMLTSPASSVTPLRPTSWTFPISPALPFPGAGNPNWLRAPPRMPSSACWPRPMPSSPDGSYNTSRRPLLTYHHVLLFLTSSCSFSLPSLSLSQLLGSNVCPHPHHTLIFYLDYVTGEHLRPGLYCCDTTQHRHCRTSFIRGYDSKPGYHLSCWYDSRPLP